MVEVPFTGVDGEYVQMPPRNVMPKPYQQPHPPLWVACSRRDTILLAASKGMGALTFAFIDPEEARNWVTEYERVLAADCLPVGWSVNPQVACVSPMMIHHDEDEAIRRGVEGAELLRRTASATTTCSAPTGPAAPTSGPSTRSAGPPRASTPTPSPGP